MKKRKDGLYQAQIVVGYTPILNEDGTPKVDEKGKPLKKKIVHTVYGSKKEVSEKIAQAKIDHGKGVDIKAANDNFKLWAYRFITNKETRGLSYGHLDRLRSDLKHLAPLDDVPLSKITIGDIQAIIDTLAKWHDGRAGLAKKSLTSIKQTAGGVLKLAIASRVLTFNPAEHVTIPENAPKEHREPVSEEVQGWINATEHRCKLAAMIMLYAGLRRGELLALSWSDINTEAGTITVNKTVQFDGGRPVLALGHTKTDAGLRTVDIPKRLCTYLEAERQKANHVYVVHNRQGGLMSQSGWRRMWESYLATLNLWHGYTEEERQKKGITSVHNPKGIEMRIEPFTAHQLRHTFCTLMYHAGVDVLTARDQMGHRDIQTTLQIYTHLDKVHKRKSMNKLDDYLGQYADSKAHKNNTIVRLETLKA